MTFAEDLKRTASAGRVQDVRIVVQRIQKSCITEAEQCNTSLRFVQPNPRTSAWMGTQDSTGVVDEANEVALFETDVAHALADFGLRDVSVAVSRSRKSIKIECGWTGTPSSHDAEFVRQLNGLVFTQRKLNMGARERICAKVFNTFRAECIKQASLGISCARSAIDFSADLERDLARRSNPLGLGRRSATPPLGSANDWTFAMMNDGAVDGRKVLQCRIAQELESLGLDNLSIEMAEEGRALHLTCPPTGNVCVSVGMYKGWDVAPRVYPCSRYTACGTKCAVCEAQFQYDGQLSTQAIVVSYRAAPSPSTKGVSPSPKRVASSISVPSATSSHPRIREASESAEVRDGFTKFRGGATHRLKELHFLRQLRQGGAFSSKDGTPDPDRKKAGTPSRPAEASPMTDAVRRVGKISAVLRNSKARVARRIAMEDVLVATPKRVQGDGEASPQTVISDAGLTPARDGTANA